MRTKLFNLMVFAGLGLLAGGKAHAQTQTEYNFTPLRGVWLAESRTTARSINDVGQVAGLDEVGFGDPIIWNDATPTRLPKNGHSMTVNGINNAGEMAGSVWAGGFQHAFLFNSPRSPTGTLLIDPGIAYAINDAGEVAGANGRATVWFPAPTTGPGTAGGSDITPQITLDTPDGQASEARAINNQGQVAGRYFATTGNQISHATVWNGTESVTLGGLAGWSSWANTINDSGQVAGAAQVNGPLGLHHAVLWNGTTPTDLGTLGGERSEAYGINNTGLVVGRSDLPDGSSHATLWNGTSAIDLNIFLNDRAVNSGWVLTHAYDINNSGWIVGDAHNARESVGFLLTPIAEPEIYAMFLAGLGLLASMRSTRSPQSNLKNCFSRAAYPAEDIKLLVSQNQAGAMMVCAEK